MSLVSGLRVIRRAIRDRRRQAVAERVSRELAGTTTYSFTTDYVSAVAEVWKQHLGPLVGKPSLRFLEVGSFEGRSAIWMFENVLTDPSATLTCVDPFFVPATEVRFDHNLRVGRFQDRVRKLKARSEVLLPDLAGEDFDAIYIDGSHRALHVLQDAVAAWRLLAASGLLIFDDYEWKPTRDAEARPQLAIDFFLRAYRDELELLHKGYQVIVRKRGTDSG